MLKQIIALCLVATAACAQDSKQELFMDIIPAKKGSIHIEKIVNTTDSLSKKELYMRAKKWAVNNIRSSKSAIDYDDVETGQIVFKTSFEYGFTITLLTTQQSYITFTMTMDVRDNKYRYIMENFNIKYSTVVKPYQNVDEALEYWINGRFSGRKKQAENIYYEIQSIESSIVKAMNQPLVADGF
jgi:hypothetical protein